MSRRQSRQDGRQIRGPQSALTDFLASHNISAARIASTVAHRQAAAQASRASANQQNANSTPGTVNSTGSANNSAPAADIEDSDNDEPLDDDDTQSSNRRVRSRRLQVKIRPTAKSKNLEKKKQKRKMADMESDFEAGDIAPLPGQMENCAICGKRFTVTPYSRAAPDGGLLCNPCGKELDKEDGAAKKKKPRPCGPVGRRRKVQSNILDGTYQIGPKSLTTLCIETLAKNIDLAEDLGDLPSHMVDKIARLLSKRRLLEPRSLQLFLKPSNDSVSVYDCAKLSSDDLVRIFQAVPGLKHLKLRNVIQFKDEVMDYLLSRHIGLESLYLHGANLLSDKKWREYLVTKGNVLKSLKVYYTDRHFGDEIVALLKTHTPSLIRLKISNNQQVSGKGIKEIANIKTLEHLSFQLHQSVHSDIYVHVLSKIGQKLKTLSLSIAPEVDNTVLDAIHAKCRSLTKLRITESEDMTDAGFARLFTDWANPPLTFIDFQKSRFLDSANPRANKDKIGLCSDGFRALMKHSGKNIRHLNVHACRHISSEAFEDVFAPDIVYPELRDLEISFCEEVTDFIVGSIFRSCPNLRELNVFGCMKIKDVVVPRGKILVGVPNAVGMHIEGAD